MPLVQECYEMYILSEDPHDEGGTLDTTFILAAEPDVGGFVVDAYLHDESSTITHPDMRECLVETLMSLEFEPPEVGGMQEVRFPFTFRRAADFPAGDPRPTP